MNHRYRRLLTPILLLALILGSTTATALFAEKQADPPTSISSTKDPTSHEKVSKEKLRRYVAAEFKKLGLKPAGDNGGYFQPFMASRWRGVPFNLKLAPPRDAIKTTDSTSSSPLTSTISGRSTRQKNADDPATESDEEDIPWQDTEADRVERTWKMWEDEQVYHLAYQFAGWCRRNYSAQLGKYKDFECRNVVALLPGTDPKLKDEVMVLSAHYDHMGIWRGDIYNGADDNASGTAAILELARVLKKQGTRRSILFIAFDAEEKGLWGSRNWVEYPTVPLAKIVTHLNLDMVGRMRYDQMYILGADCSDPLLAMITEKAYDAEITTTELGSYPGGDHWAFFRERIPSVMFFTGLHEDYHLPTDDTEKIDFDAMTKTLEMILEVVKELDARAEKVKFTADSISDFVLIGKDRNFQNQLCSSHAQRLCGRGAWYPLS